jgi:hypothetical protein
VAMTPREQKLVLILPAMGVIAIYGLFWFRPQIAKKASAEREAVAARAKAPLMAEIQAQQAKLQAVQRELNQESQEFAAVDKRWRAAAGKDDRLPSRPQRIERLTEMFAQAGLHVIEAGDVESIREGKALPALDATARDLAELSENQQPRRWQVRFRGTYADVFATLDKLAAGEIIAVPLGLTMKTIKGAAPDTDWREWTLQVWV